MPRARNTIISLDDTPYYHCVARCVRRAFLCGVDHYTGNDYEHRRQWLEEKLHSTAAAFAIKLCAYAVMSNHYHVVLHVRVDLASEWSDRNVVTRWHSLFSGNLLSQRFLSGEPLSDIQRELLSKDIEIWRARLCDISWYMRIVNEAIARKANAEDQCTGRFSTIAPCIVLPPASLQSWEGRFKSQALLDERALLACMAYVDLNPVRASMSDSPETSDHTCVKQRIDALEKNQPEKKTIESFVGSKAEIIGIPFRLIEYVELIDWTERIIRDGKRGAIDDALTSILERLTFNQEAWRVLTTKFEQQFNHWVGSENIVKKTYSDKHYQRIPSTANHKSVFG
ncbi:MAG: REP element-mobilizing transposase RayT [Arenicella sp.]|jgi:REP element-mobilizing transposase RayT